MAKARIKDQRRVDDFYARKAREERFPARSVYKLEEADRKHGLLKAGQRVLDLGCAPGSWTLYAAHRVGPGGLVIGLDLSEVRSRFPDHVRLIQADVLATSPAVLAESGPFDVVLSDLAPRTTGQKNVDQVRSAGLARAALAWARALLRPEGTFFFKVFQGPETEAVLREAAGDFRIFRRVKPKSSRSFSFEMFGLGLGFKKS
ncbi:MAG: RlmE family RNA methyltransferase [Thermodesulfobacteriota bacterium]